LPFSSWLTKIISEKLTFDFEVNSIDKNRVIGKKPWFSGLGSQLRTKNKGSQMGLFKAKKPVLLS
jgi:hypothetical protein